MDVMRGDIEGRERVVVAKHHGSGRAQWLMLLAPVVAAYGQQQWSYSMVTWACSRGLTVLLHIPTVAALIVIGIAASAAYRLFQRVGQQEVHDERSSDARARFMAVTTLIVAGFSLLLVVGQWLPTVFIHPCVR